MIGIDTNVLVRFLIVDDDELSSSDEFNKNLENPDIDLMSQGMRAKILISLDAIFVPLTVFLETEWVLRSIYKFSPVKISAAFRAFAGLPNVTVESPQRLMVALDRTDGGMDFADALHVGAIAAGDVFATFDKRLRAVALRLGVPHVGSV